MNSVNTNVGAMIALQNLNATNVELATVQNRINTGKRINSAKDNGAIWAIAQSQRGESQAMNAVKESLQRGQSTIDVAMAAAESISDLLLQMKEKALAAKDAAVTTSSRTSLNDDFKALRDQITTIVNNADFNGANVIRNSTDATTVSALANTKSAAGGGSVITITAASLVLGSGNITVASDTTFSTATQADDALTLVNASIAKVSEVLTKFGTGSKALGAHLNFVTKLQDSLDAGVGALVDADLAKEGARLSALQTKQQLGVQALSIANQSSSILLGLFQR